MNRTLIEKIGDNRNVKSAGSVGTKVFKNKSWEDAICDEEYKGIQNWWESGNFDR